MKVLALGGCGDMGRMAVAVLLESPKVKSITIADINFEFATKYVNLFRSEKLSAAQIDVTKKNELVDLISRHDLVVSTIGPYFRFAKLIIEAVIEAKKPCVDICDDWKPMQEILKLNEKPKEAGITVIVGIGASPGITNILAVLAASEFDDVDELTTAWGIKLMKEGKRPRFYYKKKKIYKKMGMPLSSGAAALVHLFHESIGKVPTFKDGKLIEIDALIKADPIKFPGLPNTEAYHLGHPEPVTLCRTIKANTISNVMYLGPTIMGILHKYRRKIEDKDLTLQEAATQFEREEEKLRKIKTIYKIYKEIKNFPPIICVNVTGMKDGKRKKIAVGISRAPYDEMAGVTGVPLAIAALMIIDGKIDKKGILTPEDAINPKDFFNRLAIYCGKKLTGKDLIIKKEISL